jgi:hypothetical protein
MLLTSIAINLLFIMTCILSFINDNWIFNNFGVFGFAIEYDNTSTKQDVYKKKHI